MKVISQFVLLLVALHENCVAQPIQYVNALKCSDQLSIDDIVRRVMAYENGQTIDCDSTTYDMSSDDVKQRMASTRDKRQNKIAEFEIDDKKIVIIIMNNINNNAVATANAVAAPSNSDGGRPVTQFVQQPPDETTKRAVATHNKPHTNGIAPSAHQSTYDASLLPITFPSSYPTYGDDRPSRPQPQPSTSTNGNIYAMRPNYQFLQNSGYGSNTYGTMYGKPPTGHRFN